MTRLYLIRHGESEWNAQLRIQGHLGGGLTPRGRAQAHATGRRLLRERIGALFSSDLARAVETAEIIGQLLEAPVNRDPRLRERDMGAFSGLVWDDVVQRYPTRWRDVFQGDAAAPDGESRADVARRMATFARALLDDPPAVRVAVVGHGGSLRSLIAWLLGLDDRHGWRIRLDNCALTIADVYPAGPIFDRVNDRAHLE
ncbi:MAG: histidine phosphatase family protein, partial [Dehalococcoidia bacterium]|nr:histidine phosphatase family protein [Dehalococcoidia bacterium]